MSLTESRVTTAEAQTNQPSVQLQLPHGTELFTAGGLHQLFERVDLRSDKPVEHSWLYLPTAADRLNEAQQGPFDGTRIGTRLEIDEGYLYPLIRNQQIQGVLSCPDGSSLVLSDEQLREMDRFFCQQRRDSELDSGEIAIEFAQELFQRDDGMDQFLKRLLSLLVAYWPRSSAGIYVDHQGVYQLRMVVGHVMRCHELPSHLSQEATFKFVEALSQRENLVPAETLPNTPIYLDLPPDFFFVHQGLRSERANHLLVMVGGGNATRRTVQKVRTVAKLLSHLQESQFATTRDLVEFYSRIGSAGPSRFSLDAEIKDLYGMITRQASASRMTVSRLNAAGAYATSWIASGYPNTQVRAVEGTAGVVPDSLRPQILRGQTCHIPNITQGELSDQEAKQRYLENIQSEIFLPIRRQQSVVGSLEVGSPITGDYLTRFAPLLEAVAGYTGTLMALESLSDQIVIPAGGEQAPARASTRLGTARKLLDGFLHGLSSRISVVVGQTELLSANYDDPQRTMQSDRTQIEKIALAGTELASHIASLRTVVGLLESPDDASVDGAQFLRELPGMFEGFTRRIKDTRNVDLPITYTVSVRQSFRLRTSDAIDVIIPFVMAIMEQAICSGTLSMQGNSKGTTPNISLQFRRNLLGYVTIEDVLNRLFPEVERVSGSNAEEQYRVRDTVFSSRLIDTEAYQVLLTCGSVPPGDTTIRVNRKR